MSYSVTLTDDTNLGSGIRLLSYVCIKTNASSDIILDIYDGSDDTGELKYTRRVSGTMRSTFDTFQVPIRFGSGFYVSVSTSSTTHNIVLGFV